MKADLAAFCGHWRSVGYNRLLSITEHHYYLFTVTTNQCSLCEEGSIEEFHRGYDRLQLHDSDHFSFYYAGDLTCYHYHRVDGFPDQRPLHEDNCNDPETNFEDFWQVFLENYAFFDLHHNGWNLKYEHFRPRVTPTTSDRELLDIFKQMIAPLRDGHVYVDNGNERVHSASSNLGPGEALKRLFDLPQPLISKRICVDKISSRLENTLLAPFASSRSQLTRAGNDVLSWCELGKGIGYLNILRLFGFANTPAHRTANDLPHKPHDCGPFLHADMSALNDVLDKYMKDMTNMDVMIVDARINGGGFDRAALEIANRFADHERTAYYKKARLCNKAQADDDFTEEQAIQLTPHSGGCFNKPVYLLISPFTLSAGEVFALCMAAIPHVQLLGEPTRGILSDNLFHKLPNGWEISLSNEVYLSSEHICYESIGVTPDHALPPLGENLRNDLQQGLLAAVEYVKQSQD